MHLIELAAHHRSQNVLSKKSLKSILEDNMRQVHCVIVNYFLIRVSRSIIQRTQFLETQTVKGKIKEIIKTHKLIE